MRNSNDRRRVIRKDISRNSGLLDSRDLKMLRRNSRPRIMDIGQDLRHSRGRERSTHRRCNDLNSQCLRTKQ